MVPKEKPNLKRSASQVARSKQNKSYSFVFALLALLNYNSQVDVGQPPGKGAKLEPNVKTELKLEPKDDQNTVAPLSLCRPTITKIVYRFFFLK